MVDDILESDKVDVQIDGNTMVNLFDTEILPIYLDRVVQGEEMVDLTEVIPKKTIKPQTKYTMQIRYKVSGYGNKTGSSSVYGYANIGPKILYSDGTVEHIYFEKVISSKGYYTQTLTFTPKSSIERIDLSLLMIKVYLQMAIEEVILVEGEYSDKDLKYFEGLKSVGELEGNLSILSNNSQIKLNSSESLVCHINPSKSSANNNTLPDLSGNGNNITLYNVAQEDINDGYVQFNGTNSYATIPRMVDNDFTIEIKVNVEEVRNGTSSRGHWYNEPGIIDAETASVVNDFGVTVNRLGNVLFGVGNMDETYADDKSRLNEEMTIIISRNKDIGLMDLYINGEYLETIKNGNKNSLDASSILTIAKANARDGYCKMKLYELKIYNKYFKLEDFFVSDKNVFNLKEPLRKISDEVKDRIVKVNGQWMIERNCGQVRYDGSSYENWIHSTNQTDNKEAMFYIYNPDRKEFSEGISNSFDTLSNYELGNPEGIYYGIDFNIRIANEKLERLDLDGFRKYLSQNPLEIVYQLNEPKYESLRVSSNISIYEGITRILSNSTIPCNMNINVDRAPNLAKEAINRALSNPSAENLSNARYWTNLLKESTLKDSFQDQINNNTNVLDMNVEKKSTSANTDVYVKLKNTLSLSLDTNNIIFDDVDSTQDTELKNAVNLTVSSSLPYRVNAYLEDEIYNSDKTATLDKSTLNIKVNSDNSYKAFSNTTDPILLVDNHNEGVDISHGLDFMLSGGNTHKADVYKTTVKIEVEQK